MTNELLVEESSYFKEIALIVLKPDSIEYVLENHFIKDLKDIGLITRYRQLIRFTPEDIQFVYPELVQNNEIFPIIKEYMSSGPSMLLLGKSTFKCSEIDIHDYVKKKKGRADEDGLRRKYIYVFEEELRRIYPDRKRFLYELSKNRIHSPEDVEEAFNLFLYLWPKLDHNGIANVFPDLYNIVKRRFSIQKYVGK